LPAIEAQIAPETTVEEPIPTGTERILFIDDEKELAKLGSRLLEPLGYEVTTRTSSMEALELFKAHPDRFDLVITDMTMPNMTGDNMAQEMMRIRGGIPIILCTGFSARIDEIKAKAMGIRAFVLKPIVKNDLARKIRMALDQPEARKIAIAGVS
jgi:CheY-like chemotaxis protein